MQQLRSAIDANAPQVIQAFQQQLSGGSQQQAASHEHSRSASETFALTAPHVVRRLFQIVQGSQVHTLQPDTIYTLDATPSASSDAAANNKSGSIPIFVDERQSISGTQAKIYNDEFTLVRAVEASSSSDGSAPQPNIAATLNGRELEFNKPYSLKDGDVIKFGLNVHTNIHVTMLSPQASLHQNLKLQQQLAEGTISLSAVDPAAAPAVVAGSSPNAPVEGAVVSDAALQPQQIAVSGPAGDPIIEAANKKENEAMQDDVGKSDIVLGDVVSSEGERDQLGVPLNQQQHETMHSKAIHRSPSPSNSSFLQQRANQTFEKEESALGGANGGSIDGKSGVDVTNTKTESTNPFAPAPAERTADTEFHYAPSI